MQQSTTQRPSLVIRLIVVILCSIIVSAGGTLVYAEREWNKADMALQAKQPCATAQTTD